MQKGGEELLPDPQVDPGHGEGEAASSAACGQRALGSGGMGQRKGTRRRAGGIVGGKQRRKHRMKRNAKLGEVYRDRQERNEPDKDSGKRGRNKQRTRGKKAW